MARTRCATSSATNPAILPVHDIAPSFARLFTVARELAIATVGFVDMLLADESGLPAVVEHKLWRNPQPRGEAVGQILDYARELAWYANEDLPRRSCAPPAAAG